ncbi:MAG: DNA processing protein, partial [Alphaproteobacteria bacterium]
MKRPLSHRERISWTRLARTPGVGSLTFHRLLEQHRKIDDALDALPRLSKGRLTPPSADAVEHEIEALEALGARLIASCEPDYPQLLAQIDPCPPVLCVRGNTTLFGKPLVAIVGAREASAAGQKLAAQFAREL